MILGVVRSGRAATAPFAVAGYIAAAYWFTSSTSFANPAVTIGRTLSDTFAGIEPALGARVHRVAQLIGGTPRHRACARCLLIPDLPAPVDLVVLARSSVRAPA